MRAQFGKVNTMHTHILPWADRPLVLQNLVGGEEGLADAGVSLSKLIPNGFMFLDAIGEVYRGDSDVFPERPRSELNYLGRLRGYRDLTEGHQPRPRRVLRPADRARAFPDFDTQLIGFDATFRYRPLRRAIYRQFVGRTEAHLEPAGRARRRAAGRVRDSIASGDYQFARRWFIGVRGDRSGRAARRRPARYGRIDLPDVPAQRVQPGSRPVSAHQLRRGHDANEFLFQFNFAIGAHGAHPF